MSRVSRFLTLTGLFCTLFLAACAGPTTYTTPLEEAQGDVLTSHQEMMTFLTELQAGTEAFTLDTVGTSVEGRPIVLLHFTSGSGEGSEGSGGQGTATGGDPLKVFIFAQQHGNEPSGKEAAIALARDVATGAFTGFMPQVDFYLIPQVNPDGSEAQERRNANDMDLNRDHLTLTTPEVQAVHAVFQDIMPHVVLDVHEYGITSSSWVDQGIRKDFGQQIGGLSNTNMPMALRSYAWDQVIPAMEEELEARDVALQRYLVTDGPDARFRYSTAALNDGRNSTGIYNTLSFLIEGRNGLTVEESIRERTRQQLETMKAFLRYLGDHAGEVKSLVEGEREKLAGPNPPEQVDLVMDYVPDPQRPTVSVGVVDVESGARDTLVIEAFHPRVEASVSVTRPEGYLVPSSLQDVLGVLERHGIETIPVDAPMTVRAQVYQIREVEETTKEDKDFLEVRVTSQERRMEVPGDHFYVPSQGLQSNLIVSLLEPQSQWGLAPLPEFQYMLEPGSQYPIVRVLEVME